MHSGSSAKEKAIRLFVYGTLRKRGVANHFLHNYAAVQEGVWLSGFAMYDAGWYPFVVPAAAETKIIGDIYEIPAGKLKELDEYEGPGYKKLYLEKLQAYIYIKADESIEGFEKVPDGDWLKYRNKKSG